jgi:hypothetical protein
LCYELDLEQASNPHAIAHAVLEHFRESDDVHLLFLRVELDLEPPTTSLYHGCATHVFLTQWNRYSDGFTATIRDLFLHLGDSHAHEGRSANRCAKSAGIMEETIAVPVLGRLHLSSALTCMSLVFQGVLPKLQSVWQEPGTGTVNDVIPEIVALLEEARPLIICMVHLLTDENDYGRKAVLVPNAICL